MSYDPNIISPEGRAVQASGFKGLRDQMGVQNMLSPDFLRLLALKQQADRIQQSQPPPQAPPTTVAQDLAQQVNSRDQGVAGLNPQNVGNGMAGGGIVAFAGEAGSLVGSTRSMMGASPSVASYAEALADVAASEGAITAEEAAALKTPGGNPGFKAKAAAKVNSWAENLKRVGRTPVGPGTPGGSALGRGLAGAAGKTVPALLGIGALEGAAGAVDLNDKYDPNSIREAYQSLGYSPEDSAVSKFLLTDWAGQPGGGEGLGAAKGVASDLALKGLGVTNQTLGGVTKAANWMLPEKLEIPFKPIFDVVDENRAKKEAKAAETAATASADDFNPYSYFGSDPSSGGLAAIYQNQADQLKPYSLTAGLENPERPDRTAMQEAIRKEDAEAGLGKAREEELAKIQQDKAEQKGEKKRDTWLAAAEGFFKMAESASRPGATFLGSAAEGATSGLSSYKQVLKDSEQSEKELRKAEYALKQAAEDFKTNQSARAESRYAAEQTSYENAANRDAQRQDRLVQMNAQIAIARLNATTQMHIARLADQKGQEIMDTIGRISTDGQKKGQSVSQIDANIKRYLEAVGLTTQATSGAYQAALLKPQPMAGLLTGGAGSDEGFSAKQISQDREQ